MDNYTPVDVLCSVEETLFKKGFRLRDEQKIQNGIGATYENREGRIIRVACEQTDEGVRTRTHSRSPKTGSTEEDWILDQLRQKKKDWTGDIEAILNNVTDRIASKPGVTETNIGFDEWENQWSLSLRKHPETRIDIGVKKLSSFGKIYDLTADVYLESNPNIGQEYSRYGLRYPELESAILRVASLEPTRHEPFADRKANDLSDPQHQLLMVVFEDIEDGPENFTYSSRLPKRVDPRSLEVLQKKGYVVYTTDEFICPEDVQYPAPKKIEMTPQGKRYCREIKSAKLAGCGGECSCGDECACGGDCNCK